jgi:hypothetical protein
VHHPRSSRLGQPGYPILRPGGPLRRSHTGSRLWRRVPVRRVGKRPALDECRSGREAHLALTAHCFVFLRIGDLELRARLAAEGLGSRCSTVQDCGVHFTASEKMTGRQRVHRSGGGPAGCARRGDRPTQLVSECQKNDQGFDSPWGQQRVKNGLRSRSTRRPRDGVAALPAVSVRPVSLRFWHAHCCHFSPLS